MSIEPDTKDWTWVLERPCPECGLDAAAVSPGALADAFAETWPRWASVLVDPDCAVRPAAAHLVAAGVRLPRPRRAPGLR